MEKSEYLEIVSVFDDLSLELDSREVKDDARRQDYWKKIGAKEELALAKNAVLKQADKQVVGSSIIVSFSVRGYISTASYGVYVAEAEDLIFRVEAAMASGKVKLVVLDFYGVDDCSPAFAAVLAKIKDKVADCVNCCGSVNAKLSKAGYSRIHRWGTLDR